MPSARNELKTLSEENAERVARHMAMAAQVIDDDPELAHEHAQAAMRHAGRVGVVRETLAITAYATGDFALALRELRTVRRITGRNDHAAMIVDSERGVGRPEKALEEGRGVNREDLPVEQRVELAIALSGARLDLGQTELALHELEIPEDDPDRAFGWSAGLFAARAAVLSDLGRDDEAAEWARRAEVAGDAVASRLAEGDTVVIHEMYIETDDDVAGRDSDASAFDAPVSADDETDVEDETTLGEAPTGDQSVADESEADGATLPEADDVQAAAASVDESTSDDATSVDEPASDDVTSADATANSARSEDVSEVAAADDAVADDNAADAVTPAGDATQAGTPAPDVPAAENPGEDITPDDIVVDDQSIDEEVAELLAAAGITDDEDGADENGKTS